MYLIVVTDFTLTHHFWYDKRAELILVPTNRVKALALSAGISAERVKVSGLPVNINFPLDMRPDKIRKQLGWITDKITIILMGGGDGIGLIYNIAQANNRQHLDIQLVILTGENKKLKRRLDKCDWNQKTHIYPFIDNVPTLMCASDFVITKAGPTSICESLVAGLPIIISDVIPGQETGNMEYVIENEVGEYCYDPNDIAITVKCWVNDGKEVLKERSQRSRNLSKPNASFVVADEIWKWAHHGPILSDFHKLINPRS